MGTVALTTLLMFLGWISKWMIPPVPAAAAARAAGAKPKQRSRKLVGGIPILGQYEGKAYYRFYQ